MSSSLLESLNCVYKVNDVGLYYGDEETLCKIILTFDENVSYLLCAKNPFHKNVVGYENKCSKDHQEYLVAYRPENNVMALNMVDAPKVEFFSDKMIYPAIEFIGKELENHRNVVVICNKGESRSPTMCLMYMMKNNVFDKNLSHSEVFSEFSKLARNWNPRLGILQYCVSYWDKYRKGELN